MPQPNRAMTESFPFGNQVGAYPIRLRFNRTNVPCNITWENRGPVDMTVKLQDSADGSTWADVSAVYNQASTAANAVVVPDGRVSAGGVTLRQYVRVVPVAGATEGELLLTPEVAAIEIMKV